MGVYLRGAYSRVHSNAALCFLCIAHLLILSILARQKAVSILIKDNTANETRKLRSLS